MYLSGYLSSEMTSLDIGASVRPILLQPFLFLLHTPVASQVPAHSGREAPPRAEVGGGAASEARTGERIRVLDRCRGCCRAAAAWAARAFAAAR